MNKVFLIGTVNGVYWLCIPYEGNEALVNTNKTFKFEY